MKISEKDIAAYRASAEKQWQYARIKAEVIEI